MERHVKKEIEVKNLTSCIRCVASKREWVHEECVFCILLGSLLGVIGIHSALHHAFIMVDATTKHIPSVGHPLLFSREHNRLVVQLLIPNGHV